MQVDSVEKQLEGLRAEGERGLFTVGRARPGEGPDLKAFCEDANSGAVVVEDFDAVAPFVGEDEKGAGLETLFFETVGDDDESVE